MTEQRPETDWSHLSDKELYAAISAAVSNKILHEELCDELEDRILWNMAP